MRLSRRSIPRRTMWFGLLAILAFGALGSAVAIGALTSPPPPMIAIEIGILFAIRFFHISISSLK